MKSMPQIRINFSPLLYDYVARDKYKLYADTWGDIPSYEQCEEWTDNYRAAWQEQESKILPTLEQVLGLSFRQPIIDAHTVPGIRDMSDPLIMNFMTDAGTFVDRLTHELIHTLLTDNTAYSLNDTNKPTWLGDEWQKLFGDHDFDTLVHIPVHAIHKHIYLDTLKEPKRLERDMASTADNKPYADAWRYVNDHDYMKIITDLKELYSAYAG
ncbi:MAG TPA: hypothetical protein VLG11_01465 [Candidatus Saccharimonadales bacterium]|nr:hypothetical protein [Candidatus Saccharimonadales bacterium]